MRIGPILITALAFGLITADANASPLTYVTGNNDVEGTHHFGTVDLCYRDLSANRSERAGGN